MISNFILFLFYSIIFTNPIVNPRSHKSESNQGDSKPAKPTEVAKRIEPKTSAALLIIHCALSTELLRSHGNLAQNGIYKSKLVARLSRNFEFRKHKLRSRNLSHCQKKKKITRPQISISHTKSSGEQKEKKVITFAEAQL